MPLATAASREASLSLIGTGPIASTLVVVAAASFIVFVVEILFERLYTIVIGLAFAILPFVCSSFPD